MKCPKCKKTMINGYIIGDKLGIFWSSKNTHNILGFWGNWKKGVERLTKGFWKTDYKNASKCKKCKIIIFKY